MNDPVWLERNELLWTYWETCRSGSWKLLDKAESPVIESKKKCFA